MTADEQRHRQRLEREREFFDKLGESQDKLYWAEYGPAAERRRELRTTAVVAATGLAGDPEASALEVGCGCGHYTPHFARSWRGRLVAIDAVPSLLSRARGTVPAEVLLSAADAARLPFRDETFDAVIGNAILHHLPLDVALPELLRVTAPGGFVSFAEPNLLNPQVFLTLKVSWLRRRLGASPDEIAFVRWRLHSDFERHGLVDVRVVPFDFLYPLTPPSWIDTVEMIGRGLEKTPFVRELAGSLLVVGRKSSAA